MRVGVLTALLCLLRCATVLLDITSLQNVGEQLTQQYTVSSQKNGTFILDWFEDYLLSVNWLICERLFTWTQVWHTIPTAILCWINLPRTWSLPHSPVLKDADVTVSQLPVAVMSGAWHVSRPAASHCAASSLENHHHYLTLIQDVYQCNNTTVLCSSFPDDDYRYMISGEYTMWNHGELIWYKWVNVCFVMEKSATLWYQFGGLL